MKPFYIHKFSGKIDFKTGLNINPQTSMVEGIAREQRTNIKLRASNVLNDYSELLIHHDVKKNQNGITTAHFNGEVKTINFSNYLIPEKFKAYHSSSKGIIIFQANGKTARSTLSALKEISSFEVEKVPFNFEIADKLVTEYKGVWFKNINTNVTAISMSGQHVQLDEYFEILKEQGDLSNITINFEYGNAYHLVMITKSSGIILYQSYDDFEIELDIVNRVFEELISKVWELDPEVDYKRNSI